MTLTPKVLFFATDATHGTELWVTDGIYTLLVSDINPGSGSAVTGGTNITALGNGTALFTANDGTDGRELWVTDGTAAGTSLLKNIYPGSGSAVTGGTNIIALGNGKALFSAKDSSDVGY